MNETQMSQSEQQDAGSRSARQRAIDAYDRAGRKVEDGFNEAPLIALAGGLAAGALLAALLPRTESETRALRPTAKRLGGTARAAAGAAREAGSARLNELGLTAEKGLDTLRSILDSATDAAKASADAALGAARKE